MSGFEGADVGELRSLASRFDRTAAQINALTSTVGTQIGTLGWIGPDADRFRMQWSGQLRSKLKSVAAALEEIGRIARTNANQQAAASEDNAGSGQNGPGADPTSQSTGSNVPDIIGGGVQLAGLGQDSIDTIAELRDALGGAGGSFSEAIAKVARGLSKVKGLGPALGIASLGIDGDQFISSIGGADGGKTVSAFLNTAVDALGLAVPPVGIAWVAGTVIGTGIADGAEKLWDYQGDGLEAGARALFGPNATVASLTPAQSEQLSNRYVGVGGVVNSVVDDVNGVGNRVGQWENGVVDSVGTRVNSFMAGFHW